MATYLPPTENLAIFDPLVFQTGDEPLTLNEASLLFLRYPNAQGTENLQTTNVNGVLTANAGVVTNTVSALAGSPLTLNPSVGQFLISSSSLNMSGFNIADVTTISPILGNDLLIGAAINMNTFNVKNVTSLIGPTNVNMTVQAGGTGHIRLFTNSVNRLTFRDTNECFANSNGLYLQGTTVELSQVRLGFDTSVVSQGTQCVSIGGGAGRTQANQSTAIGSEAGGSSQGASSVAVGFQSGVVQGADCVSVGPISGSQQQLGSVAIGSNTGLNQNQFCVAIGRSAGQSQGLQAIAIGFEAGKSAQSQDAIAIGTDAGTTSQGRESIAIGINAGLINQASTYATTGDGSIAIGASSGGAQGLRCIAIGSFAGQTSQTSQSIAIGYSAGQNQGNSSVAVGYQAGRTNQFREGIAIGANAGLTSQGSGWTNFGDGPVAIGASSGVTSQAIKSVAIGGLAGNANQKSECVAIGYNAGATAQGTGYTIVYDGSVAIGSGAGQGTQEHRCVAIGSAAGTTTQRGSAVAIGYAAGNTNQGGSSVAIGPNAGQTNQGSSSVAIGLFAGNNGLGANSIAIGNGAATTATITGSIILNASGAAFNPATASACYIKPVRGTATAAPLMVYTAATGEVTYQTSSIKYKKNVIDFTRDTTSLYNLKTREYDTKEDNKHHIGYIAEECFDVNPVFTWTNDDGTPEGLDTFNMLVYAIEEIKKLRKDLDDLRGIQTPIAPCTIRPLVPVDVECKKKCEEKYIPPPLISPPSLFTEIDM